MYQMESTFVLANNYLFENISIYQMESTFVLANKFSLKTLVSIKWSQHV